MRKVKVGDIIRVSKGRKAAHVTNIKIENALRYIQIEDLRSDNILQYSLDKNGVFVNESDICIAWDGANAGTVGYGLSGIIGSTIARLRLEDKSIYTPYVGRFLQTKFHILNGKTTGTTIPHVERSRLDNLELSLPSFAEQRRIAAILDKADTIRRKRQEALKLADDFLNGVFLDMFGDPVTNPKGWTVEPLYDVIDEVQGGWSVGGENRVKKADEKGVLKISAVTSGKYLPQEHKAVARDDCKRGLLTPKMGDLLFTRANTRELVAATCIVDFEDEDLFLPDKIWNIIPYTHKATKIFLKALFSHPKMRSRITRQSTGTSGSMFNISKTKLLSTEFPIPDFSMQEKFSNIYISSMNAMKKYSLLYNEAVNMANSLSSSFFKEH